jgi:pilus assembly protein CpaC
LSTSIRVRISVLAAILAILCCWTVAAASAFELVPTRGEPLVVQLNEGTLVRLDQTPKAVVIANADIADISIRSPTLMYVFGKRTGETTMYAVDSREHVLFNITLRVVHNLSRLKETLAQLVPAGQIEVQSLDTGILLQGSVATAAEADDAVRLVSHFVGKGEDVINRLQVTAPNQVNLRVRIAEVSRTVVRQLGIDWSAIGSIGSFTFGLATQNFAAATAGIAAGAPAGNFGQFGVKSGRWDVNALIDALATQGLVSLLAEPNLTALSGETASFLAGGQYPIPVPQSTGGGSVITITYKNYGVSLSFTPTLVAGSRISMRVQPEVSQLDTSNAITVGSYVVPALTTREAQTTIELASGQSFAIAGLIQNNSKLANNSVPGLGDIPVLGELFKSDKFQRDQTELVIIVTPYIVTPVSARLPAPTDGTIVPQTSGLNPQGGTSGILPPTQPQQSQAGGLNGPAGFGVE